MPCLMGNPSRPRSAGGAIVASKQSTMACRGPRARRNNAARALGYWREVLASCRNLALCGEIYLAYRGKRTAFIRASLLQPVWMREASVACLVRLVDSFA